ncbi:hypothetical protein JRO89_XS05G0169100 [Xanthoceras sorbifolium]|uniref:Retrotransposon gag domain-containing protein n=1 Tax=Xanthoceras sorbifolium TaxID=99658 RepID=A0ABQ8I2Q6_9ROSI|nr:hypothetical protein JRO89_XS05G0169100 [Xanthoceras sorbifolium]
MPVINYEEKFSKLVWLVPFIQEDEEQRCKRFMVGLNLRIKIHLSLAPQTHYRELVEAAMKVERKATTITQGRPDNKRSRSSSSQSGFNQTSRKKSKTKWTGGKGTYREATFSQGSVRSSTTPGEGHFIKECPQLVTTNGSEAGTGTVAPTPSTGGPRPTGKGFQTRGASIATGRGAKGRGTGSRGGTPVG